MSYQQSNDYRYNPPYVVPVQVASELQEFIPLFTGYVMYEAMVNSQKNQVRNLYLQLLEEDDKIVAMAAQSTADLVEFYLRRDGTDFRYVEQLIKETCKMVTNAMVAMAVNQYPQQFNQYLTEQEAADMEPYILQYQHEMEQAKQFFSGGQSSFSSNARTGGNTGGNFSRGRQGAGSVRSFVSETPDVNNDAFARAVSGGTSGTRGISRLGSKSAAARNSLNTGVWTEDGIPNRGQQVEGTGTGGYGRRRNVNQIREEAAQQAGAAAAPTRRRGAVIDPEYQQPAVKKSAALEIDGAVLHPMTSESEWPKVLNPQRPMDWMVVEGGIQFQPAFLSKWKPSTDLSNPYPKWYDPAQAILFNVKREDGVVIQKAIERKSYMNYLDNELDPAMRELEEKRLRERDARAMPAWNMVAQMRPVPDRPLSTTVEVDESVEGMEMSAISKAIIPVVTELGTSYSQTFFNYARRFGEKMTNTAAELYFDRAELVQVLSVDWEGLYELANADSFEDVMLRLDSMRQESADLAHLADLRLTDVLNWTLRYRMGIKWTIELFSSDYIELRNEIEKTYGDLPVNALDESSIEVVAMALTHFGRTQARGIANQFGGTLSEDDEPMLYWRERSSVTRVPLKQVDLALPDHEVSVERQVNSELYATLESIFERTEDTPVLYRHRYLVTTDDKWYEIARGALDRSSILIFPVAVPK